MNNNNFNVPKTKQEELLKMAGKQLGKDPSQLKKQLESGNINDVLASLSPQQAAQVKSALANPQVLNQLLSNPQISKFFGNMNR